MYMEAPGEAEAQVAALNKAAIINAGVTDDGDAILFGCIKVLSGFSNKCYVNEIDVEILLKNLGMTREQLIDLGIILGTDYCQGITGLKPIDAYKKFKKTNFNIKDF